MLRKVLAVGLPILIIVVAVLSMKSLMKRDVKIGKTEDEVAPLPVRIAVAEAAPNQYLVRALGETMAAQSVRLQPEVSGLVASLHPNMVLGGKVLQGDMLVQIEKSDYLLAIRQAQAQVGQAEVRLQEEKGRVAVAKSEWRLLGDESLSTSRGKALALRKPQLKSAQLNLEAAIAGLERSELTLKRTTIKAPINGVIQEENIDLGQRVTPGQPVATIIGTDHWWVQVSVSASTLQRISAKGVTAQVYARDKADAMEARFLRTLPDVDRSGKMLRVLLQVSDPMRLNNDGQPLFLGDTVHVEFRCPTPSQTLILPRQALRNDGQIWSIDGSESGKEVGVGRLVYLTPEVVFKDKTHIYVRNIPLGTVAIKSNLALPTPGTAVRWTKEKADAQEEASATPAKTTSP